MNRTILASALAVSLIAPAAASAHPGVYTVTQKVANGAETFTQDPTGANLTNRIQYNVANDGWARSFTEDNGLTVGPGMINYKAMPSSWRTPMSADQKRTFANAQTGLQPHATCTGIGLEDGAVILSWQEDPFFNYVPFQSTSAGSGTSRAKGTAWARARRGPARPAVPARRAGRRPPARAAPTARRTRARALPTRRPPRPPPPRPRRCRARSPRCRPA